MLSLIFFGILTAFLGFLLLIFDWIFVKESKKQEGIEVITDPRTGKRRKRIFEGAFDQGVHDDIYYFAQALTSRVVFVESLVPLEKSLLIEGLFSVAKVHPLLRVKCEWQCLKGTTYRYLTEMDNFTVDDLLYSEINTEGDDWKGVLENELLTRFDLSTGPLWRVTRLKEAFDSSCNTYKNTILFTFQHSICDGLSILNYLDTLLEVMDQLFYGDLDHNLEPLPLLEPLPVLIKHRTDLSWTQVIGLKLEIYKRRLLQSLFRSTPKKLFFAKFPPPCRSDPTVKSKTTIVPNCLTVEDTRAFVDNCKLHKCTVGGALSATLAIAIRNLLNSDPSERISIGLPVNIRSGCKPVVNAKAFGLYIGLLFIPFSFVNEIPELDEYFWELARKTSSVIRQKVSEDEQYNLHIQRKYGVGYNSKDLIAVARKDLFDAGRYPNFELSNVGSYDLDKQRIYKITETYAGVAQDVVGPMMTVCALTVSGKLCFNVTHSTRAVSEDVAGKYSEGILKLIKDIGCSQKGLN